MTPQEQLDALIRAGAIFWQMRNGDTILQTMGMARLVQGGMFWSAAFPEGSGDYHFLAFDGDPSMEAGEMIFPGLDAGIVPIEQMGETPLQEQQTYRDEWNHALAADQARYLQGFEDAMTEQQIRA